MAWLLGKMDVRKRSEALTIVLGRGLSLTVANDSPWWIRSTKGSTWLHTIARCVTRLQGSGSARRVYDPWILWEILSRAQVSILKL
jgi:hypothetical protein